MTSFPSSVTRYWVLAAQTWAQALYHTTLRYFPGMWTLVDSRERFDFLVQYDRLPDVTFVLHWHWLVPAVYVQENVTIGFHSSPLPKFRGGSPIQNQLKRGILDTMLTAFRLDAGLDTGPILSQMPLSLRGSRDEVLERIGGHVARMMPRLVAGAYEERPQSGENSFYTRKDAADFVWA